MMTLRSLVLVFAVFVAAAGCGKEGGDKSDPGTGNGDQPAAATDAAKPATADAAAPASTADAAAPEPAGDADAAPAATDGDGDADGPNSGPPKNLKVLSKKWDRKKVTNYMKKTVNRGLGVKCKYCHDTKDYASDDNKKKRAARKMMKMTRSMNRKFFGGKNKITCFTCHKGKKELD